MSNWCFCQSRATGYGGRKQQVKFTHAQISTVSFSSPQPSPQLSMPKVPNAEKEKHQIKSLRMIEENLSRFIQIQCWLVGKWDGSLLEALCPDLLSRMSPRPWALSRSFKRVTSSFSSRTSLALGSSLITALHLICLARSAYLRACESV